MRYLILGGLIAGLISGTATAQTDKRTEALNAMEACRGISIAEVRLACLDAAASILDEIDASTPQATTPDQPVLPQPAPPQPVLEQPQAQNNLEQAAANIEAERQRLDAERASLEAEREAIEKRRIELAELEEKEKAEQRRFSPLAPFTGASQPKEIPVTIVKITINSRKQHKFYTSDGDTLTQSDLTQRLYAPSALPAKANVVRSLAGSKWIIFDELPNKRLKVSLPTWGDLQN